MIRVVIKPAKRRFGIPPRKQWRYTVVAANGEPLDPRDTYANPEDIVDALRAIREQDVTIEIHYPEDVWESRL